MEVINPQQMKAQTLPPLIKQSTTYKLFVPRKVEEKIRYLIRKFPNTEWSGILFIKHSGSFENNDLEIYCEDIYPMDLGTSGWTEFKMSEDVTAYIADNLELFDCDLALCHSHHRLGAFFSGQDLKTLQIEGNDTNCFVSLIVDTPGKYVAAITRKVHSKKNIITEYLGSSYEFFGEGVKQLTGEDVGKEEEEETTAIEYFMLDIEREVVDNPFDFLDKRFEEIEKLKKKNQPVVTTYKPKEDDEFFSWIHSNRKTSAEAKEALYTAPKEQTLFDEQTMKEMEVPTDGWTPDPDLIHPMIYKLITGSLFANKDIDLKQWIVRYMKTKYSELFGNEDSLYFWNWAECIIEFLLNSYEDNSIPDALYDDIDYLQSKVASAMYNELSAYPENPYIDKYQEILSHYIYE